MGCNCNGSTMIDHIYWLFNYKWCIEHFLSMSRWVLFSKNNPSCTAEMNRSTVHSTGISGGVYLGGRNIKPTHGDFINQLLRFCLGKAPTVFHLWRKFENITGFTWLSWLCRQGSLVKGIPLPDPWSRPGGIHCWVVTIGSVLLAIYRYSIG
jgi:hypothetical protein